MSNILEMPRPASITQKTMGMNGCRNCRIYAQCGGHHLPVIFQTGCANYVGSEPTDTDDMNPHFAERFWQLWEDVDGLYDYSVGPLRSMSAAGLPRYIPQLQGRSLHPSRPLQLKVVALRLFQVIGLRRGGYGVKYKTAAELRAAYRLAPDTRVILVGVDKDRPLERFWQHHGSQVCEAIAGLNLEVTIPNYSFFTCVPSFQILRNRKRILLVAERLSKAGVRVALHLNAITEADWAFWVDFLREHTEVATVALEFQTGPLANHARGQQAFDELDNLLDRVGRPLHVLLVGAARFYLQARERRWNFTIIDSEPYMFAQHRRLLEKGKSGNFALRLVPTSAGAPVYHLFEANLRSYEKSLTAGTVSPRELPMESRNQAGFLW
ncbi:MAG: DUF4417 domain-containing protein [Verrucomicrobiota bacterium]